MNIYLSISSQRTNGLSRTRWPSSCPLNDLSLLSNEININLSTHNSKRHLAVSIQHNKDRYQGTFTLLISSHLIWARVIWTECAVKWPSLFWSVTATANWVASQHVTARNLELMKRGQMRWDEMSSVNDPLFHRHKATRRVLVDNFPAGAQLYEKSHLKKLPIVQWPSRSRKVIVMADIR